MVLGFLVATAWIPESLAQKKAPEVDPNVEHAKRVHAILESIATYEEIFNGKDLSGWNGDTEGYVVEDGILICQKGAKVLATDKAYGDFAFTFDFKVEESGNNGIGIRVPEGGTHPYRDSLEIQILDHRGSKYNSKTEGGKNMTWLKPWQVHGSIYGVVPAKTGYLKPIDRWNTQTIVAVEDHIMVILNGAVILDAFLEDVTPYEGKKRAGLLNRVGHILLAGHNDRVEFRNLKVADLSPASPMLKNAADNTPPEGFTALFNGTDLSGWKGLAHKRAPERRALKGDELKKAQAKADEVMREHWSVVEGILTYDGKGASLCTAKDYGDFELYVDWKIPPGADSGLYLRGTPQIQIWDPWDVSTKDKPTPETPEDWLKAYRTGRNLGSGGLWNNRRASNRPLVLADKRPGEWNTFFIRMVGDKVSIWLNGKLVVDRTRLENFWDKTRTEPLPRADQIELQHHGSELFFKNIYIRELPY